MVQPQKESFQLNRRAEKNALKTLLKKNELGTLLPLGLLLIVVAIFIDKYRRRASGGE